MTQTFLHVVSISASNVASPVRCERQCAMEDSAPSCTMIKGVTCPPCSYHLQPFLWTSRFDVIKIPTRSTFAQDRIDHSEVLFNLDSELIQWERSTLQQNLNLFPQTILTDTILFCFAASNFRFLSWAAVCIFKTSALKWIGASRRHDVWLIRLMR